MIIKFSPSPHLDFRKTRKTASLAFFFPFLTFLGNIVKSELWGYLLLSSISTNLIRNKHFNSMHSNYDENRYEYHTSDLKNFFTIEISCDVKAEFSTNPFCNVGAMHRSHLNMCAFSLLCKNWNSVTIHFDGPNFFRSENLRTFRKKGISMNN